MPPILPAQLTPLIYDPAQAQNLILNQITNYQINDPTNPAIMLLEAGCTLAAASALEAEAALKKIYPSLATNTDEIFTHIADKDLINVFSHPSETNVVFYVSIRDLKSNGVYNKSLGFVETIIPADTTVDITGIPFVLLNDIHIKLYDTGVVFAEQLNSKDIAANNSLGILSSGIVNFQDGEPWIAVETVIKQLKKSTIVKPITAAEGFRLDVKHTDKYHYSDVYYKNANTNNVWAKLTTTHSDTYINPNVPAISVAVLDQLIRYTIPDVYLISGQVSGELMIILYETKGYLDLPIYKYKMAEYVVTVNATTTDPVKASISNITVYANSRDIVNGGSSGYTFQELKDSVINNTLGHEQLPVTTAQLKRAATVHGFDLHSMLDVVTDRVFVAARNMSRYDSKLVYARPDVFFNTVNIDLSVINNSKVVVATDYALIPSGTLFKEVNGVVSILNDLEVANLTSLSNIDLVNHLKTNRIFFTPYYYILNTTDTSVIDTRVYDLDNPDLRNIKITGKNTNVLERANVGKFGLIRTPTGYDLIISVLSNNEFKNSNTNLLKGQLSIDIHNGQSTIHFAGIYDPATELMTFKIDTNFNITPSDELEVINGISNVTNKFVSLLSTGRIYLYTTDVNIVDRSNYLVNEISIPDTNVTVFDREEITIEFGRSVNYIWNKMFNSFTDRKYKRYTVDKPMVYQQDVYQVDPVTGSIITVTKDAAGNLVTNKTLLHAKGDPILDANGNPMFEYRAGDVMVDANNLPIIDMLGGVMRHVDILMLEYEFLAATGTTSKNYLQAIKDTINGWLFNNLVSLNSVVLENTQVLYKSYKKSQDIEISVESLRARVPYTVRPTVTVYSTRNDYSGVELNNLTTEIGYLIHKHLDGQNVNISELKKEIIANVDSSIVTVKIDGIETFRNSEVFNTVDPMTRLSMGKVLTINNNNELIVNYDLTIKIHKV